MPCVIEAGRRYGLLRHPGGSVFCSARQCGPLRHVLSRSRFHATRIGSILPARAKDLKAPDWPFSAVELQSARAAKISCGYAANLWLAGGFGGALRRYLALSRPGLPEYLEWPPSRSVLISTVRGLADAAVTATNENTNAISSTVSSGAGVYVFPNLPVGTYQVRVTSPGFAPYTRSAVPGNRLTKHRCYRHSAN